MFCFFQDCYIIIYEYNRLAHILLTVRLERVCVYYSLQLHVWSRQAHDVNTTSPQRRATSWRCIDVEPTLYKRHVSAGIWAVPSERVSSSLQTMHRFRLIPRMRKVSSGHLLSIDKFCGMSLLADSEGPDQTARMRRLIWAFAVRTCPKTCFRLAWPISQTKFRNTAY